MNKLQIIRNHQQSAPVQVIPLAEELGVDVYKVDWPDNMSGRIEKDENYSIYVNQNHHVNRRRFTVAHEIAHFILHRNQIGDGINDDAMYRSGMPLKVEFEANKLAADILMPWHLLNEYMEDDYTVESLANTFQVSKSAMSIRLGIPYEN